MTHIGFDPGYGNTKLYGHEGGLALPSHVAVKQNGHLARMEGMQLRRPPLAVTVGAQAFYVGAGAHDWGAPVESLDYTRLSGSPAIRATLYAALSQYQRQHGVITGPITLIVGLPLGALGDEQKAVSAEMKQWLTGEHAWQANDAAHTVTIARALLQTMNGSGAYSLGELDDRLRAGVSDSAALDLWLSGVNGQIEKQWGDRWRQFAQIIVVGGGSLLLRGQLTNYFRGKCHIPDEPVLAVARGLYKLLRLQNGRQGGGR